MKYQILFCAFLVFVLSMPALAGTKQAVKKNKNQASIKLVRVSKPQQRQVASAAMMKPVSRQTPKQKQKQKPILVATAQKPLPYSQVKIQNRAIEAGPVSVARDKFPKPRFSSLNRKVASD